MLSTLYGYSDGLQVVGGDIVDTEFKALFIVFSCYSAIHENKPLYSLIYGYFPQAISYICLSLNTVICCAYFVYFEPWRVFGESLKGWLFALFGPVGYTLVLIFLFVFSFYCLAKKVEVLLTIKKISSYILVFVTLVSLFAYQNPSYGGWIGERIAQDIFIKFFSEILGFILLLILFIISIVLMEWISIEKFANWFFARGERDEDESEGDEDEDGEEEEYGEDSDGEDEEEEEDLEEGEEEEEEEEEEIKPKGKKTSGVYKYVPPPLSILSKNSKGGGSGNTKANIEIIKRTLNNFNVLVEVEEVVVGPTFTQYALKPASNVRLQKIVSLQNNLELALAAHPIRIESPIPGKSLVGIEVPNHTKEVVGLRSLLESKEFKNFPAALPVVIGKTITGSPLVFSLAKLPHLLLAGTTGSGKSVLIHNLILSLLYKNSPDELRLILIDPKRVEMCFYEDIPHLYTDIITHPKKALNALNWAIAEMERRYELLEGIKVRSLESYNQAISKKKDKEDGEATLPYIVITIDELSDLMATAPREFENAIVRVAQKSRAVGIHLIISTQRPSVNVITGLVKANIPARIALQVASQVDSRTILDTAGAETLVGSGDLLFATSGGRKAIRAQSAFVTEDEVKQVAHALIKRNVLPLPNIELEQMDSRSQISNSISSSDDELLDEARVIVISAKKASTSLLQRKLKIGYARAARLMDLLEEAGVVGPQVGAKAREILVVEGEDVMGEENRE